MIKATVTIRISSYDETPKVFLFEKKKDAVRFKNMLEKGALLKLGIRTCTVLLEYVEPIG